MINIKCQDIQDLKIKMAQYWVEGRQFSLAELP